MNVQAATLKGVVEEKVSKQTKNTRSFCCIFPFQNTSKYILPPVPQKNPKEGRVSLSIS